MSTKLFKKLAAVISAGIIGSTMAMGGFASANTTKTIWDNQYGDLYSDSYGNTYHMYTLSGRKDDDSPIYFSNSGYYSYNSTHINSTAPCFLYVYGYNQGDPWWVLNDVNTYRGRSLTTTGIYIEMGYTRLIRQYINEKGYNGARVLVKNFEGVGQSRGTWSPDSTNSDQRYYKYAN